jgi:23S rRNA U2552 (ribose-2'-O)-methylase RlmE/FtsJ
MKRLANDTYRGIVSCPCVAIHTEETQVKRFQDRILKEDEDVHVLLTHSPLIFLQKNSSAIDDTYSKQMNSLFRSSLEKKCGSGRISAHRIYQLDYSCNDPEWIIYSKEMLALRRASTTLRVVSFPKSLQPKITQLLSKEGFQVNPTRHSYEIHVVYVPGCSPYFHFGVVSTSERILQEEKENHEAIARPKTAANAPCRAYFKMQESLERVPIEHGCRVLDVGASPGGWTECLVSHGVSVVAVDPGELTIDLKKKPVTHLQMLLEDAIAQLELMSRFHMCVCDINMRVERMAQLMLSIADFLLPDARVVFTLKLGKKPTDLAVKKAYHQVKAILSPAFKDFQLVWLHANTMNERTLFAKKKKKIGDIN